MKTIYFSNSKKSDTSKLLQFSLNATDFLAKNFPRSTEFLGHKLLFNPYSKRKYQLDKRANIEEFSVNSPEGKIKLYRYENKQRTLKGLNRHILLSHGWSDTSRSFNELAYGLSEQGHTVWCFDHIGHGHSSGNKAHLFAFISGMNEVIKFIEQEKNQWISTIIGHSMGAVALLNLDEEILKSKKVVFISTPFEFFELMGKRISGAGISTKFVEHLLEKYSAKYNKQWQSLSPINNIEKLGKNALFIHDTKDRYAPAKVVQDICQEYNLNLISTSGLGHVRILRSKQIKENIISYLEN